MLNLRVPSGLERGQMEFNIMHRFFGPVDEDPLGTFFGMDTGANAHLMLRGPVWRALEVRGGYTRDFSEWILGAGYSLDIPEAFLRFQVGAEFFSLEESEVAERQGDVFIHTALQSEPLGDRLSVSVNTGYDGHNDRGGLGLGARLSVRERLSLQVEYYPVLDGDRDAPNTPLGPEDAIAFGVEIQTYGHHFTLMVGNAWELGTRRLMLGTYSEDLHFGFNIQRLFEF
jgi:hypothetical protein